MRLLYQRDELLRFIREQGQTSAEARQVASRQRQLIEQRFKLLLDESGGKGLKFRRRALVQDRHTEAIESYCLMLSLALEARVQYETHFMLLEAKRSLNAFSRAKSF